MKPQTSESFSKDFRLLKSFDFINLKSGSCRLRTPYFYIVYKKSKPTSRLGLSFNKKTGNAVLRNSLKRRFREWFRRSSIKGLGYDLLIISRYKSFRQNKKDWQELEKIISETTCFIQRKLKQ